jgi:hypothetical protein
MERWWYDYSNKQFALVVLHGLHLGVLPNLPPASKQSIGETLLQIRCYGEDRPARMQLTIVVHCSQRRRVRSATDRLDRFGRRTIWAARQRKIGMTSRASRCRLRRPRLPPPEPPPFIRT